MKNSILPLFIISILFTACQTENKTDEEEAQLIADSNPVNVSETHCYSYIKNNDTAKLNFISTNGIVTGELMYNLYEKDKNTGLIEGEMKGDTLIAEYNFNAEGRESIRQVVFLKKGNDLVEGFGDVEVRRGKMMFKNTATLNFGDAIVFKKVDCQ